MHDKNRLIPTHIHNDYIDLLAVSHTIRQGKWLIFLFILLASLIAFIVAYGQVTVYKADALLRVETQKATIPGLDELAGLSNDDTSVGTELELIKSRKNIATAVKSLKLDIIASPKKVLFLGNLHKRFLSPTEFKKPITNMKKLDLFLHKYAWGNEQIQIDRFDVPDSLQNKIFTLIAKAENKFIITLEDKIILEGKVGQLSTSENALFKVFISKLKGLSGTEFVLSKLSIRRAIARLQAKLVAVEKSKKTGMISLSLTGNNEKEIIKILNKIASTYVEQNKQRSSEEASNALKFLEEQIKPVKDRVNKAEAAIQTYRIKNQTTNLPLETQNILNLVAGIESEYQKLSLQKDELKQRFASKHPTIVAINEQQRKLLLRKKKVESKITKLPKKQQTLLKLEREIKVAELIYTDLLNKIQEFKIAKASTVGNAYVVDLADIDESYVKPNKKRILAIGFILGAILGLAIVILRKALRQTIENPDELEKVTDLPVYATVPFSKKSRQTIGIKKTKKQKSLLAKEHKTDPAIESLRSLRTSLHFALHDATNNIVMITGPSPGIGKSFIASNFAAVVAASGQRVILIDADMRKGYVHSLFQLNLTPGLSDIITEQASIEEATQTIDLDDATMDIITRGQKSPNPSELLMHENLKDLLNHLSKNYDLVLIDSPPVHAVTDPSIIGSHAGVVFMVVLSGQHSLREIEHAIERLSHNGVETKGFIFNGNKANSGYGYGYGYKDYYGD